MADEANKKRKFKKSKYVGANKKRRVLDSLAVGMKGVLVTCNEKEKNCVREAYNVLNEYADKLYGSQFSSQMEPNDSSEDDDIEEAIAKEKEDMKTAVRRFQSVKSGAKNVIFIRTGLPDDKDPDHLVHEILLDVLHNGYQKTRHCLRFLPVGTCCYARTEEIEKAAEKYFKQYFFSEDTKPMKFCVVYKARNNTMVNREDIIGTLARLVLHSGKDHAVNLKYPDLTICVEIIRNICCLAIVKDYHKLKKYNIQEVQSAATQKDMTPEDSQGINNTNDKERNHTQVLCKDTDSGNGEDEQEGKETVKEDDDQKVDVSKLKKEEEQNLGLESREEEKGTPVKMHLNKTVKTEIKDEKQEELEKCYQRNNIEEEVESRVKEKD